MVIHIHPAIHILSEIIHISTHKFGNYWLNIEASLPLHKQNTIAMCAFLAWSHWSHSCCLRYTTLDPVGLRWYCSNNTCLISPQIKDTHFVCFLYNTLQHYYTAIAQRSEPACWLGKHSFSDSVMKVLFIMPSIWVEPAICALY